VDEGLTEQLARAHGVEPLALHLLYYVRMEQAAPDAFIQFVGNLEERPAGTSPEDRSWIASYGAAFDELLARGFVTILTREQIEAEQARLARREVPELVRVAGVRPGFIDFTEAGYALRREYVRANLGEEALDKSESGWNLSPDRRRFDIYAPTARACGARMSELLRFPRSYGGLSSLVIERQDPVEIGPWRPNAFTLRPKGFHGVLIVASS
jgi:hypothetical protein